MRRAAGNGKMQQPHNRGVVYPSHPVFTKRIRSERASAEQVGNTNGNRTAQR